MIIKEVEDFYEFELEGLDDNIHVIYEKICEREPKFNNDYQLISEVECGIYEEISVYSESSTLIKKAYYRIGRDVNNVTEALNLISHKFGHKLSA